MGQQLPTKWTVISDVTQGSARTITSTKEDNGGQMFTAGGKLILGPRLPELPESLLKRCTPKERQKLKDDMDKYNQQITLILRSIA